MPYFEVIKMNLRQTDLNLLYPKFKLKVESLLTAAKNSGLQVNVYESFRYLVRQAELLDQGRPFPWAVSASTLPKVTSAFPGEGLHSYGLAVDIIFNKATGYAHGWDSKHPWAALGKLGEAEGLTWGGTFKSFDGPHFEYRIPQGFDLKYHYKKGGLVEVWNELDKIK